jgi:hypothetical protein
MFDVRIRTISTLAEILLILAILAGCAPMSISPSEIAQGSSKEDVIALFGEPDRTQEFVIPDEPFFGPQENLITLVLPAPWSRNGCMKLGMKNCISGLQEMMTSRVKPGRFWIWGDTPKTPSSKTRSTARG